jgi:hypothetical protein
MQQDIGNHIRCERVGGREIVVLLTMTPSMLRSVTTRAISAIMKGSRSGASLRSSLGRLSEESRAAQAAFRRRSNAPGF